MTQVVAKAERNAGALRSSRYYKRVRHLAVIAGLAAVIAAMITAGAPALAAPARVKPAALPFAVDWTRDYDGAAPVAAAVSDAGLLIVGFANRIEAISLTSGNTEWSLPVPAPRLACDATSCIAGDNTVVRAIDLARKTVRWQKPAPGPLAFAPILRSGWVFLTATDGRVIALHDTDGATLWTFAADGALTGPPSVDGDRLAVATARSTVSLLDLNTGRALWTTLPLAGLPGAPRLGGGMVYVGTENRELAVIDAPTGKLKFSARTGGIVMGAPALDDRFVYGAGQDGVLRAFDRGSGALRWYADLPTRPAGVGPVTDDGLTIIALRNGAFQAYLATSDGKTSAAVIAPPGAGDSTVLLPTPPMIAGAGAAMRLVTLSSSVGDDSKWTAAVIRAAAGLRLSALPATIPGLALTLTPPR